MVRNGPCGYPPNLRGPSGHRSTSRLFGTQPEVFIFSFFNSNIENVCVGRDGSRVVGTSQKTKDRWIMIDFKCGGCGQHLESPEGFAGETIECPSCGLEITIPNGNEEDSRLDSLAQALRPGVN